MSGLDAGDLSAGAQRANEATKFHAALLSPASSNGNATLDAGCRLNEGLQLGICPSAINDGYVGGTSHKHWPVATALL